MLRGTAARDLIGSLAWFLVTARCLSAQPLLNLADTFHGVPFVRASQVALSADGAFLYASDSISGLTVFRRGAAGEPLDVLASYFGRGGGDAFEGVGDFLLSPDEAHVYVPGGTRLAVLARDRESGLLTRIQTLAAGEAGLPDVTYIRSLVFSPLGDFLYLGWTDSGAQRLAVLAREPATGRLSFVQQLTSPATAFTTHVSRLLISPGGEHVYSLGAPAVSTFARDPASGKLTFVDAIERLAGDDETLISTSAGAVRPDGGALYLIGANACYNSCRRDAVAALAREPRSGRLELLELASDSIHDRLSTLAVSADGRHLYLPDVDLGRSRISVYAPLADGRLERLSAFLGQPSAKWGEVSTLAFDASGRQLYASGFEGRPLPHFDRDPATGALAFEPPPGDPTEGITGLYDLAVSPDGEHLYATGSHSESIATFGWDDDDGALLPLAASFSSEPGFEGLGLEVSLAMSRDGSRLYAAGYTLTSFARGPDGALDPVSTLDPAGRVGSLLNVAVSPDNRHVYLLGYFGAAAVSRDPATDELAIVQILAPSFSFHSLAFSPDGVFGYAAVSFECDPDGCRSALLVLERDVSTGRLTVRDTVLGAGSMAFGSAGTVVLSPGGRHLYVDSFQSGALAVSGFFRDPADGSLAFIDVVFEPQPSGGAHYGQRTLAISPDGRHLYALSTLADSLVVLERDPGIGRLKRLETITEGDSGPGGLSSPTAVAVGADSQLVFVAGSRRSALTAFSRRCVSVASACARGDRFRVDVAWRDFDGRSGKARHLEPLGDSSRIFWFFDRDNWEMMVKVLDGCRINERAWVYAAATTDVETELTVTDTWTGRRRTYASALGEAAPAVTDTDAFDACDLQTSRTTAGGSRPVPAPATRSVKAGCGGGPGLCVADRFDVRVEWRDNAGNAGVGRPVPLESAASGIFWFFDRDNWEMMVKVLDGCQINDRVWVFAASPTDVETKLTVTDRLTGARQVYAKPLGVAAPAVTDTDAFDACREPRD